MKDLLLDDDHDLEVVDNDFAWAEENKEIQQAGRIYTWTFSGEWYWDTRLGLPWLDGLLDVSVFTALQRDTILKRNFLSVPGTTAITRYEPRSDQINRATIIYYDVRTIYSTGNVLNEIRV